MNTFNPKKRKVLKYKEFLTTGAKSEKAKHKEKGEHELTKKAMSGDKKGDNGIATLDEAKEMRVVLDATEFANVLKALVRGEEAVLINVGTNVKMILKDIGFNEILTILDETKKDVERQKK